MNIRGKTRPAAAFSRVFSVGGYRPERVVTNDEICRHIDSSDEWIVRRTGIRTRRFAGPRETLAYMAGTAASKALAAAGVAASQLDGVMVATMSHLRQAPSLAAEVAQRLGIAAPAMDVSAACAGFCYALTMADHMIQAGTARYVLVIGAERMSDIVDPTDPTCSFIFSDGAGAVVLGPSSVRGIGPVSWGSEPAGISAVAMDAAWGGAQRPYLRMAGPQVFRWVTSAMVDVARSALTAAEVSAADLGAFIPHQANLRITETLAASLGLPPTTALATDVVDQGNASAASIPLAMDRMLATGQAASGDLALLLGFGSGLVYAAQVVRLP
jgi:3-oxoacyl-[acyl-carrier-protein] synthase-3